MSSSYYAENRTENNRDTGFVLTVSDDGIGIPYTVDTVNPDSLGLQLVNILVAQLDSEMEVKTKKGTEFTIKLNAAENL